MQVAGDKVGATAVKKLKAQARVNKATTDATAAQANLNTLAQKILPGTSAPTTEPEATTAPSATVPNVPTGDRYSNAPGSSTRGHGSRRHGLA